MSALNATAKATLRACGVSQAGWARRNYFSDGKWGGDACGCPDDRCIGYHHDDPDDCGCLRALLDDLGRERQYMRAAASAPLRGIDLSRERPGELPS